MEFMRIIKKYHTQFLAIAVFIGAISCSSSKMNTRRTLPKKGKMKPCDCPTSGYYKPYYDATSLFS